MTSDPKEKVAVRMGFPLGFGILAGLSQPAVEWLIAFGIVSGSVLSEGSFLQRLFMVLQCVALGAIGVILFWIVCMLKPGLFQWLDKWLTYLFVAVGGLSLLTFGAYALMTKPLAHGRPLLDFVNGSMTGTGAFLLWWVMVFYKHDHYDPAA